MRRNLHVLIVLAAVGTALVAQTGVAAARGGGGGNYHHGCTSPFYNQNTCITVYYSPSGSQYTVSQITVAYDNNSTGTFCGRYAVENGNDAYIFGPSANSYCYGGGGGGTHTWKPGKNYPSGYTFCAEFSSTRSWASVKSSASRAAPCTWGRHRNVRGSWRFRAAPSSQR